MSLLKNDNSLKEPKAKPNVTSLTISDGWNFGIGFGLAMTIALPIILILLSCVIGIGFLILGNSVSALFGA